MRLTDASMHGLKHFAERKCQKQAWTNLWICIYAYKLKSDFNKQ